MTSPQCYKCSVGSSPHPWCDDGSENWADLPAWLESNGGPQHLLEPADPVLGLVTLILTCAGVLAAFLPVIVIVATPR